MKNHRTEKQKQKRKRKVKIMKWYRTDYRRLMNKLRRKDFGKPKKKKENKVLKPYRVIILQGKVERLEADIRALEHKDPMRENLVKKLKELKNKLGK
jgi:hypothetical protein